MLDSQSILRSLGLALWIATSVFDQPLLAQAINIDFGEPDDGPASSYGAAGLPGVWNSLRGDHLATTLNLLDVEGLPTAVSLQQIGGLDTLTVIDPDTDTDDSALMDDYLVTFNTTLESCVFLDGVAPGTYEVLVYARMPNEPTVLSYADVDQEPGNPHYEVGGVWPGGHQEFITFSRHLAEVGPDGNLDLHSGIAPGANAAAGAALNGLQIRPLTPIFEDGFESGDTTGWHASFP